MKMKLLFGIVLLPFLPMAQDGSAQDSGPETPPSGFSFTVVGGVVVGQFRDQLTVVDDKNRRIESLDNNGKRFTFAAPLMDAGVQYGFGDSGTALTLGFNADHLSGESLVGISQSLGQAGTLYGGLIYLEQEVWQHPYQTGVNRVSTDSVDIGLSLGYENIGNTGLEIEYRYLNTDVDQDRIGALSPSLQRDGNTHVLEGGWVIPLDENNTLVPSLSLIQKNMDGRANRCRDLSLGLAYVYEQGRLSVSTGVWLGRTHFDQQHPVFNQTREDRSYMAELGFTWSELWGVASLQGQIGVVYGQQNANINFFDADVALLTTGVTYAFR